jgi:hypothetical protein
MVYSHLIYYILNKIRPIQKLCWMSSIVWDVHDVSEPGSVFVIGCKAGMDHEAQLSKTPPPLHLMTKTDPVPETLRLTNIPGTLDGVQ